jgi:general stress protein 26
MDRATEKAILRELKRHDTMAIATVRADGYPQVTTVTYANDGLILYFGCDRGAQKVKNLRRSSKVSLAIDRDVRDWSTIKGLSMAADAYVLRGRKDIQHALGLLQLKFTQWNEIDLNELKSLAFVKVVPRVVSLLDYSKGFGHTELVKL